MRTIPMDDAAVMWERLCTVNVLWSSVLVGSHSLSIPVLEDDREYYKEHLQLAVFVCEQGTVIFDPTYCSVIVNGQTEFVEKIEGELV